MNRSIPTNETGLERGPRRARLEGGVPNRKTGFESKRTHGRGDERTNRTGGGEDGGPNALKTLAPMEGRRNMNCAEHRGSANADVPKTDTLGEKQSNEKKIKLNVLGKPIRGSFVVGSAVSAQT